MTDYGVFANFVAGATTATAAGGAVTLLFTKRAKWQPPKEAVSDGVARLASLVAVVLCVTIWVFHPSLGRSELLLTAAGLATAAVLALLASLTTNIVFSYYWPVEETEANRLLGGFWLTREASDIRQERNQTVQEMFADVHGDKDKVWPRLSRAVTHMASTVGYILLISTGAGALAAVGALAAQWINAGGAA